MAHTMESPSVEPKGTRLSHSASCHVPVSMKTNQHGSCSGIINGRPKTCAFHELATVAPGGKLGVNRQETGISCAGILRFALLQNRQTTGAFHSSFPALQNGRSQFVINGNWKISIPGEYNIAGTKLLYRRSADTWESFEVPGPTREDLHLMVNQHRLDSNSHRVN